MRTLFLACAALLISASCLGQCPSADLNGDCHVSLADLAILANNWEIEPDMTDLVTMSNQWLTGTPGPKGMVFVDIPAGTFRMGDSFKEGNSDELPVHTVTLSAFSMSKYEITNRQYCEFLNSAYPAQIKVVDGVIYAASDTENSNPYFSTSSAPADFPDYGQFSSIDFNDPDFTVRGKGGTDMGNDPVVCVSWEGAKAFCDYYGYQLPTEAQWEYAARGGLSDSRFPWGDTITHDHANYYSLASFIYDISITTGYHPTWNDQISPYTSPTGSCPDSVNGFGLHDMAGNVWEWCADWYSPTYYSTSPKKDPKGPSAGRHRIIRGGAWYAFANQCRIAARYSNFIPTYRYSYSVGFRVCMK